MESGPAFDGRLARMEDEPLPDSGRLEDLLKSIDGRSYPSYKRLKGRWELGQTTLFIDHVQGDPFAAPSKVRIRVHTDVPKEVCLNPQQKLAAEDWLLRAFSQGLSGHRRGSGKSGEIRVYRPGPEVVERSALRLDSQGFAEVRMEVGLPARGRRVLGREAWELLSEDLPTAAARLGVAPSMAPHIHSVMRQQSLRAALDEAGLVAFIADGSCLPRASGISQAPLDGAVPFLSPPSLSVTLPTCEGPVTGMGIPRGVTLIVGGGFHGKSTLLQAIERGHLDHIPGDGRERVVARPDAAKVRAEDGRPVRGVDISAFLGDQPGGRGTRPFSTDDASGSTSQAAAIMESIEAGAGLLLLDEDTSASNLLVRDARMRQLIPAAREPITSLVQRVQQMHQAWGVSMVLVAGGVGDYLAVADTVIGMNRFHAEDMSKQARSIAGELPDSPGPLRKPLTRRPQRAGLEPGKVRARDTRRVDYNRQEIDLTAVDQVIDSAHAATLGHAIAVLHGHIVDGNRTLSECLVALERLMGADGVEALSPREYPDGRLVRPRTIEVAAALNRLRSLRVSPK